MVHLLLVQKGYPYPESVADCIKSIPITDGLRWNCYGDVWPVIADATRGVRTRDRGYANYPIFEGLPHIRSLIRDSDTVIVFGSERDEIISAAIEMAFAKGIPVRNYDE